jgi:hypothetical protein
VPGARCRPAAALAGVAVVLQLGAATPAHAAGTRIVCASRAPLYETPGHLVVGVVSRGDRVVMLRRGARGWAHVRTSFEVVGWMKRRALC